MEEKITVTEEVVANETVIEEKALKEKSPVLENIGNFFFDDFSRTRVYYTPIICLFKSYQFLRHLQADIAENAQCIGYQYIHSTFQGGGVQAFLLLPVAFKSIK